QGGTSSHAEGAAGRGFGAVADPDAVLGPDPGLRAVLPHVGLGRDATGDVDAGDTGDAPVVRARGRVAHHPGSAVHGVVRGSGHAAPDHGPAPIGAGEVRHLVTAGRGVQRFGDE